MRVAGSSLPDEGVGAAYGNARERAREDRRWRKIREEVKAGSLVKVCGDDELVEHRSGASCLGKETKTRCG